MEDMNDAADFIDSQKIIYELKPRPYRNVPTNPEGFKEARPLTSKELKRTGQIPFVRLLGGREPLSNLKIRYELYKKNWSRQMHAINAVLMKTDRFKFRSLKEFLNTPQGGDDTKRKLEKRLTTALLNLGSNISNHDRLLGNVCKYLREDENVCLVKINPNVCFNIQKIVRRIEDTVACKLYELEHSNRGKKRKTTNNDGSPRKRRIIEADTDTYVPPTRVDDDSENEDDTDMILQMNNNFDVLPTKIERGKFVDIEDMLETFRKKNVKLVVLIQNADAMSSTLIERTLTVLHKYCQTSATYGIIGISTPFIIFQEKIPSMLIGKLETRSFAIDNSKETIDQIMEDLLLNINETYNSLIFDPKLVLKFLSKRDVMSIQQFTNYMKMIYMRHYFSQPLSVFWTNDFSRIDLRKTYFEIFKTLPSVIENSDVIEKRHLIGIAENNVEIIGDMLRTNLNKLINWRYEFRNLIDFLNFAQASLLEQKIWSNNLELFQLLFEKYYQLRDSEENWNDNTDEMRNTLNVVDTAADVKKSPTRRRKRKSSKNDRISALVLTQFLQPLWDKIKEHENESVISFHKQLTHDAQFKFITDNEHYPYRYGYMKPERLIMSIRMALREQIIDLDLDSQAFREICVVREDTILKIHDGFEPCLRENCLANLDEPGKSLFDSLHWVNPVIKTEKEEVDELEIIEGIDTDKDKEYEYEYENKVLDVQMFKVMEPVICEMYRILKETGVTTNIYDFYQVFKSSIIMKEKVVKILNKKLLLGKDKFKEEEFDELRQILNAIGRDDDAEGRDAWDKVTLAWFLKSLAEFQMLGLIREGGSKSQSLEKVIWRGI